MFPVTDFSKLTFLFVPRKRLQQAKAVRDCPWVHPVWYP